MSTVLEILSNTPNQGRNFSIPNQPLNEPVRVSRYVDPLGIEIELEGTDLPTTGYLENIVSKSGARWEAKADGSLRGGLEYTLIKPCREEEVEGLVQGLFDVFKARKTALVPSNRCSIHVHYNVGGLKVNSITSIIALWTIFEEPLLRWWGQERYRNHFCLSSKDEESSIKAWTRFLKEGYLPEEEALRYTALNLVAIRKYGSVEFRGGGVVPTASVAVNWSRFLFRLCEYAKNTYQNPQHLAYDLSERNPEGILEDICGEEFREFFSEVIKTVPDFRRCCLESFYNIQPIILGFPWDEWLPEIEKQYVPNPFSSKKGKKKSHLEEGIDLAREVNLLRNHQINRIVRVHPDRDIIQEAPRVGDPLFQ